MRRALALWCLVVALSAAPAAAADPVVATAALDNREITVGDLIQLTVTVDAAPGYTITDPGVARALGDLEVFATLPVEQHRTSIGTRTIFRYRVTSYTVGDRTMPPISVGYSGPGGAGTAATQGDVVRVLSVILPEEDTSDIKPLKPQLVLAGAATAELLRRIALAAGGVLAVGLVATLIWWLTRGRRRVGADGLTPPERALAELERIAGLHLPEKGRYAEHYDLVTAALRRYVAEQYRLPAGERTARELRGEMERAGIDPQQRTAIYDVLRESDVVRFHRGQQYPAQARGAVSAAVDAIRRAAAAERVRISAIGGDA